MRTSQGAQTLAETVAAVLENDGQRFYTRHHRRPLADVAREFGAIERFYRRGLDGVARPDAQGDVIRLLFQDGSAIVVAGDAWDVEGAELCSWEGAL